jgi:hypothetical protein
MNMESVSDPEASEEPVPRRIDLTGMSAPCATLRHTSSPEATRSTMSAESVQTLVNAVLLIGVTLFAGSIGLKRFEAIDRSFEALERALTGSIDGLRNELKHDIALVDNHVGEVRTELAQTRSDLTYVALAVGARRAEGSS